MGTWDEGVLDNDTSQDGLSDLRHSVVEDIRALVTEPSSAATLGTLAAAVGVLLQLSPYSFSADCDDQALILSAIQAHLANVGVLSDAAASVLRRVGSDQQQALTEQRGALPAELCQVLHSGATNSHFGVREAALFATTEGQAYVQQIVERCLAAADSDFEDEDNWWDLNREVSAMGPLCALLVLQPSRLPVDKLNDWRSLARGGLQKLIDDEDEELEFQQPYYANVDALFAALISRDA